MKRDFRRKFMQKTVLSVKQSLTILFPLIIILAGFMACKTDDNITSDYTNEEVNGGGNADSVGSQIRIRIGTKTFTAALLNNATAIAFKARLPMTVVMSELNGNEKLYNFSANLPINTSNPGTIHVGDLMIYGSNTLVLFYKSFPTSYSYTRLGKIDDTSGLAAVIGSGNVTVTFEPE